MNTPVVSNTIGFCSAELYSVLERYYKHHPTNNDCYLFENIGFLLAYLHLTGILTPVNIQDISSYMTTELTSNHTQDKEGKRNIERAAEFYSQCFYEMLTTKTWTLPDRIVYNITRPQTWNDFSKGLPVGEVDFMEAIEVWSKIGDFISNIVNPQIAKIR